MQLELPDLTTLPLTFLQTYRSSGMISEALAAQTTFQYVTSPPSSRGARVFRGVYFHLFKSGYGVVLEDQIRGWMYMHGWNQVVFVDRLAVESGWRGRGVEESLLSFAERQAVEQRRQWIAVLVNPTEAEIVQLCLEYGFHMEHSQAFSSTVSQLSLTDPSGDVSLLPLGRTQARQAYLQYATSDIEQGEPEETVVQKWLLDRSRYWFQGQGWLVTDHGAPVAYLHLVHTLRDMTIYFACGESEWGGSWLAGALTLALGKVRAASQVMVHLGSRAHHKKALSALTDLGLISLDLPVARMFKGLKLTPTRHQRL